MTTRASPVRSDDDTASFVNNNTITVSGNVDTEQIMEELMALRDDVQAQLNEVMHSLDTLTEAVNRDNTEDASRIAELEAIIAQLQADGVTAKETIDRLQAIVDSANADSDALVTALQDVDAKVDALTTAEDA